jgi:hypothetical protein
MTRNDFIKKLIQAGLLAFLTFTVFALRKRVVSGENCSGCPGAGICSGKNECGKYLSSMP